MATVTSRRMESSRRNFLQAGSGLVGALIACGCLRPQAVRAEDWNSAAFESRALDEVIRDLGGSELSESGQVSITAPEIAENGAVVPVEIASTLPGTEVIAIAVEKNPRMLAATFSIPEGTVPEVQTRVKMAETSRVFALVRAGGKFHYAVKEIKVTAGGCGA